MNTAKQTDEIMINVQHNGQTQTAMEANVSGVTGTGVVLVDDGSIYIDGIGDVKKSRWYWCERKDGVWRTTQKVKGTP